MSSLALYQLKGICKEFVIGKIKSSALTGINLQIERGAFVALQGPSGSGKSTLLNVLGLIEQPSAGELFFAGESVSERNERYLTQLRRQSVGFIFQNYNLVPILSAQENVAYPLHLMGQMASAQVKTAADAALAAVGLEKFGRHKPAELSGGQRQRVAIARALVKNPQVILADEPTANLDSKNAEQILQLMQSLQESSGATIIVATHDPNVAARAKRQIFLRDGRIV